MPAWDVSLFSLSLSPSSLTLYLDPGDEQGKVCSRKKAVARNTLEKKTLNAQLSWIHSTREPFYLLLFSRCYHRGPLSSKRRSVQIANRFLPCACKSNQLADSTIQQSYVKNIFHKKWHGGLLRDMRLLRCQYRFTSKQKSAFLSWTRSHHRRHLQHDIWKFSYKCWGVLYCISYCIIHPGSNLQRLHKCLRRDKTLDTYTGDEAIQRACWDHLFLNTFYT